MVAAVNVTFPGNLAQVDTASDLRALPSALLLYGALYIVRELRGVYSFDPGSLAADDGQLTIRPADRSPLQAGRWVYTADGIAPGPPGKPENTFDSYTELQASDPTAGYAYLANDKDVPPRPNGSYNNPTGTVGGWVPQNAQGIAFQQTGSTAVRTLNDKARELLNVEDFRYDGITVRNDLDTLRAAIAQWQAQGGGTLSCASGRTYNLGSIVRPANIPADQPYIPELLPIAGLRNAIFEGNGSLFVMTSTSTGVRPFLFALRNYENLILRNFKVQDYGTNLNVNWRGVYVVCPLGDQSGLIQSGLTLDNVYAAFCVAFLYVSGTVSAVSGIDVLPNCNASACYYGMVFAEAGNDVTATLRTIDCMRSYFPYGVRGHRVAINFNHGPTSNGAEAMCLIKRYQSDTGDIDLTVFAKGSTANFDNIVKIEHQPDAGTGPSTFENISIRYKLAPNLDMNMSDAACDLYGQPRGSKTKPLTLSSYNGTTEETVTTSNMWKKVSVDGNFAVAPGDHIVAAVKPVRCADIALAAGVALNPTRCKTKGNINFRTANDRSFRTYKGDLTAAPFEIDLSGLDNVSTMIGVNIMLLGGTSGAGSQDRTYLEFNVFLTIPPGGPITINATPNPTNNSVGTAAGFGGFSVSGKTLSFTVSGASYATTNSFARVETVYRDQVPA